MRASVLALNAGSSSLKFALFAIDEPMETRVRGQVERIGGDASLTLQGPDGSRRNRQLEPGTDATGALDAVIEALADAEAPVAVGHRIVHGGRDFVEPCLLNGEALARLEALDPLAPLHQPHNLAAVRHFLRARPDLPQVGVFDTGFHASMPTVATRFGLPAAMHRRGIRRYGFHGISYRHAGIELERRLPQAQRAIVAHLGNGASLCALRHGRSVDTTLGFSALDGLLMGTRCGSLDPGVLLHLIEADGLSVEALEDLLYRRSGLLGVSGISHDMRDLLASKAPAAGEAIELFVYRLVKEFGALHAVLGGLDAMVFTGGIGEHAAPIREKIAQELAWTGLRIDHAANARNAPELHATDSSIACLIVACDEERVIAGACRDLLALR